MSAAGQHGSMMSGPSTAASSSTAVPFVIPLHFHVKEDSAGTQSVASDGPRLPFGWRTRWYRSAPVSKVVASSSTSRPCDDDEDEDPFDGFPDFGLKRWMTSMTAWEVEAERDDNDEEVDKDAGPSGSTSPSTNDTTAQLQIAIADEQGSVVQVPADDTSAPRQRPRKVALGDRRGGRRIAIGSQDGCVWIFQEKKQSGEAHVTTAASPSPSASPEALYMRNNRAASRTSLSILSPPTPTTALGSGFNRSPGERDGVTAAKAAPAGVSDVVASISPIFATGAEGMDAEEKLEQQWHAGRDHEGGQGGTSGVMGGVMEALGLQSNSTTECEHPHTHQHSPVPPSTPSHRRHARSNAERSSIIIPAIHGSSTPDLRTRTDSVTTDRTGSDSGSEARTSQAEAGLMSAIGLKVNKKRSFLVASGARLANGSAAQSGTATPAAPSLAPAMDRLSLSDMGKRKVRKRPLGTIEPLLSLQCPSSAPVVSLTTNKGRREGESMLSVVQQDGRVTLWSLEETLGVHTIDLRTARMPLIDSIDAQPHAGQYGHSPNTATPSPLARLAAIRSTAGSPQPRSRTNSNPVQPDPVSLPIVSMFEGVPIAYASAGLADGPSSLLACYDSTRKRLHVLDCSKATVLAQHTFTDIGLASPCVQVNADADVVDVCYVSDRAGLMVRPLRIRAKTKLASSAHLDPASGKLAPFSSAAAFLRREGYSRPPSRPVSIAEDHAADGTKDLGEAGVERDACGMRLLTDAQLVTWSARGLSLAKRVGDSLIALDRKVLKKITSVQTEQDAIVVYHAAGVEELCVDGQGRLFSRSVVESQDALEASSLLASCSTPITCFRGDDDRLLVRAGKEVVWQGEATKQAIPRHILASLPFSMERVVLSLASGHLVLCSLFELIAGRIPEPTSAPHRGDVTLLQTVTNTRTQAKHIFGGTEQGDVIVWDATTLQRQTQRSLLNAPVVAFVAITDQHSALRLHGCVACVAADSSIAILVLDGLRELYVIPGRDAPLELLAIRSNELMTLYGDGRARVWDMGGLELRRSIGVDQAVALLDDGKGWWAQFPIGADYLRREKGAAGVLSSIPSSRAHLAGTMTADVRRVVEAASRMLAPFVVAQITATASGGREADDVAALDAQPPAEAKAATKPLTMAVPQAKKALHTLRPLLQCLLPFNISDKIDTLCDTLLAAGGSSKGAISVTSGVFVEPGYLAMSLNESSAHKADQSLRVSSALTTQRIVALLAMLLVLSNIEDLREAAQALIVLLGSLNAVVGNDAYHAPTMSILTDYLTDPVMEIKRAAQTLFIASLDDMPSDDLDNICTQFNDALPNRRRIAVAAAGESAGAEQHGSTTSSPALPSVEAPTDESEEEHLSSKALLLLGLIATQRYTVMPPTMLKDIAISISQYLNDEHNAAHQSIAIVLCDRGFSIFQHYFDAMEIVRTLFGISTMAKDTAAAGMSNVISTAAAVENRDLARQATLRIAEENTPLFMTTLSLDILHARSPAHCNATMRLVAFMVRRKPLVLYPNLPRLAEAVVKSLDPTVTTMRPVIHRSATIIISELVATYPTIAFHKGLQRLAVGTFEGAVIMYDLKTATRLYVLEAHAASLNGLIFSNDGRRLISICLGDGMVKVWKTGVGLGSLFNFGGAPRQVSALLGRIGGGGGGAASTSDEAHAAAVTNADAQSSGTPAYKSFDFGRLAGSALAAVRLAVAARSPPATPTSHRSSLGTAGGQPHHQPDGGAPDEAALMMDLTLVRFEWLAERSIKIRVGEATMVFDVA